METLLVYLDYISGGSIHKLLQEYGLFREPLIRNYTTQILAGVAHLHGRSTVHRDITGANILVDPTGEIKLAGFGMAKHFAPFRPLRGGDGGAMIVPLCDVTRLEAMMMKYNFTMVLDNNYYRNILDNKGLLGVDHQLTYDKLTRPYMIKMAKSQEYLREYSRGNKILFENNPLTGDKGEIRLQYNVANKH